MNDITELRGLGEDSYDAVREMIAALEYLPTEHKVAAFDALADLLESFHEEFSRVRRISQPQTDPEKAERVDVLVNWLREKTHSKS